MPMTHRIIAAGTIMNQTAVHVDIPRWGEGKLSDHWPVSVQLQCPQDGVNTCMQHELM